MKTLRVFLSVPFFIAAWLVSSLASILVAMGEFIGPRRP